VTDAARARGKAREPTFLYLTTTGRLTGRPREIELWFTRLGDRHYLVAEHGLRAQWVRNLVADDRVQVRVGRRRFAARARVVDAAAEVTLARSVRARSERKYGWGDGLVVELTTPAGSPSSR
jgi:deazaflavin-dependent oxidoreductase (nitroreductase family)